MHVYGYPQAYERRFLLEEVQRKRCEAVGRHIPACVIKLKPRVLFVLQQRISPLVSLSLSLLQKHKFFLGFEQVCRERRKGVVTHVSATIDLNIYTV